jgi:hypothetical protein
MAQAQRLRANPDVVLRKEFDDLVLLFNPSTNMGFGLDETGLALWNMLDGKNGMPELIAGLRRSFDAVPDDVGADVEAFLNELLAEGLVGYELS